MDDENFARLADATTERLRLSADRNEELRRIIDENVVVFGLYPDPESMTRWDKLLIKGEADSSSPHIACIWCRAIEDAIELQQRAARSVG
jgi:hypothetical protein